MKIASSGTLLRCVLVIVTPLFVNATPLLSLICVRNLENVRGVRGIVLSDGAWHGQSVDVLRGVTVSVRRRDFTASTITDADGYFTFQDLPQGDYKITAELEGFLDARDTVQVRESAAADLVLVITLGGAATDDCSVVKSMPSKQARDLQEQGLPRASRRSHRNIEDATPNPSLQRTPPGDILPMTAAGRL